MIALVAALALALAGCGGDGEGQPETAPPEQAASGEQVFEEQGCGSCHTLAAAESTGQAGPDLDEVLRAKQEAFIRQSIVDPNAVIAEGFQPGVMPADFGEKLGSEELDALVSYLADSTQR